MKKIIRVLVTIIVAFTIVGCGGSSDSAQRKIVDDYFTYLKDGDSKKLSKLMNKKAEDEFGALEFSEAMEEFKGTAKDMGKKFKKECESFVKEISNSIIKEYKITEVEVDGDETIIEVSGKYLDMDAFELDDDAFDKRGSKDIEDINEDYMDGTIDDEEYEEEIIKYFDKYAKEVFDEAKDTLKDLDTKKFKATFTLVEKRDTWVIDEVSSKQKLTKGSNPNLDDDDDYDYDKSKDKDKDDRDDSAYKVDANKVKPGNTLLGKGRLVDTTKNEKYVKTSLEFIDYNVTDGNGVEIDEFSDITFSSGTMKVEVEVAGQVGDTFVLLIEDTDGTILVEETITLTEKQMVITKDITGFDINGNTINVTLFVADEYDSEYKFGGQFGYFFIWQA